MDEEREALRVLRELTDLLRPELPLLRDLVEMCVAVDDLVARARYAVAVDGEVPAVAEAPAAAPDRERPASAAAGGRASRWCRSTSSWRRTSARCSSAAPTPAARPSCSRRSVSPPRWRRAASSRRSAPGAGFPSSALLRRHRRPADRIAASLSTFSAHVRHAAPDPRRRRRRNAGAARRGRERHRSGRGRGARRRRRCASLTRRGALTLATTHLGALKELASRHAGRRERVAPVRRAPRSRRPTGSSRACRAAPTASPSRGGSACRPRSWPTRRRACPTPSAASTRCSPPSRSAQRELSARRGSAGRARCRAGRARAPGSSVQQTAQTARETRAQAAREGRRAAGRQQARALSARGAAAGRGRARRALEAPRTRPRARRGGWWKRAFGEQGEALERTERTEKTATTEREGAVEVGDRVRLAGGGAGQVLELRPTASSSWRWAR